MIGEVKFRFKDKSEQQEVKLCKITILVGDNVKYNSFLYNFMYSLFTYGREFFETRNLSEYGFMPYWICDTDEFKCSLKEGVTEDKRRRYKVSNYREALYNPRFDEYSGRPWNERRTVMCRFSDHGLDPKQSIEFANELVKNIRFGVQYVVQTHNIFFIYAMNLLLMKGLISLEEISVYEVTSNGEVRDIIMKDPHGVNYIDTSYFNNTLTKLNEEMFNILREKQGNNE